MRNPQWLEWANEIQALAQTGSQYAEDEYQLQRYLRKDVFVFLSDPKHPTVFE